jgi:acetyltransferase-like isoleucine patch superfamily enzyme
MFSSHVTLRNRDWHGIFDATTRELINPPQNVVVGSHVWLGSGVCVNKGAVIGGGTIVGQASVVSGRLKGSSMYAGVPARMVRGDVIWSRTLNPDDIPEIYSTVSQDLTELPDPSSI